MIPTSRPISSPMPWEVASAPAGSASSHPVDFTDRAPLPIRQDSDYISQYLRDMHDIFSEKILDAIAGGGSKEKDYIYRPLHYAYFDKEVFLEIEARRQSPIPAGGFGRGPVSESQFVFNQLLLEVVKETIRDANTSTFTDFDPEKPSELKGLIFDQRKMRLPISHANFISRIEWAVLKAFSKVPEQKSVTSAVYFARSSEAKHRAKEAITVRLQQSNEEMIDALAAEDFGQWLAHPDFSQRFYEEILALDPEGDRALVIDFQNLTGYCSQLEALPIGSEDVFAVVAEICAIKDRILASVVSLGLDPYMQMLATQECNEQVENAVQKHFR
ncbi:MAG: hypothetical protein NTX49_09270 [Chlamydiae bacterium]|nr:hypothetical protein [Chlamydiota bacterium]